MDQSAQTATTAPSSHRRGRDAYPVAQAQLVALGLSDELWLPTLLAHLAAGGVIMIERTGDMIIMPAALEHPSD